MAPTIGFRRLGQQDRERGQIAVPFDQSSGAGKAADRAFVQLPHGGSDPATMIVDQDAYAVGIVDAVPGEMQLLDGFDREGLDPVPRIAAEVLAGHVDIIDIEQQTAAGASDQFCEELRLRG